VAWIRSTPVAEGILAGSPDLEREFGERFLPRLQAFFRARVSNPDLREELTQETLVAALLALRAGKLREPSAIDAFVAGIARNQLAEALRLKAKDPTAAASEEIERASIASGLEPELRLTVQNELHDLAAIDQRILWLILIEGFRPSEVASQVGLTEEAVRQRKSRTLRRLHEKLFGSSVTNPPLATTLPQSSTSGTAL
jgi:RNA polymerase sigma factor (sigma-70 family)